MSASMETSKKSPASTRDSPRWIPRNSGRSRARAAESVPHEKRSFSQNRGWRPKPAAGRQSVNPNKRSFSRNHTLASKLAARAGMLLMAARENPRPRSDSKSNKPLWKRGGFPQPPRFFSANKKRESHFFQSEAFAFLWIFFPGAVRLRVEMGFVPLRAVNTRRH